jgi:hypothetical protein
VKNSFTSNSINYYQEEAVISLGEGSTTSSNTVDTDNPHDGNPNEMYHQSFQKELTELFIMNSI